MKNKPPESLIHYEIIFLMKNIGNKVPFKYDGPPIHIVLSMEFTWKNDKFWVRRKLNYSCDWHP